MAPVPGNRPRRKPLPQREEGETGLTPAKPTKPGDQRAATLPPHLTAAAPRIRWDTQRGWHTSIFQKPGFGGKRQKRGGPGGLRAAPGPRTPVCPGQTAQPLCLPSTASQAHAGPGREEGLDLHFINESMN